MKHLASSRFWALYHALPADVRQLADKNFMLLKSDPRHPSLHFKRIGELWSVRVGDHYRTLGIDVEDGICWIWIGMLSTTRSSANHAIQPTAPKAAAAG